MGPVSEPTPNSRPRQVTLVAWLTMVGSAFVVLLVFDRLAGLHTLDTRQSVEKFLAEPPGSDLGVGVDGVLSAIRTLAMVAAGCATAAAILGYQVLRRSRSARLGLTVLAVPLFFTGMVTGGFVSSLVAASAVMLWLQPARDWFDGVTRQAAAVPAAASVPATAQPRAGVPVPTAPAQPRPAGVTVACTLTWIATGFTALGMIATGVLLALEPDALLDEVHRQNPELATQGVSDDLLVGVTFAMIAGIVLWCASAAVLAVLVLRRTEWARVVLIVSTATAAALSLIGTAIGAFLLALTLVASVVTLALLLRPEARAWFSRPPGPRPPAG
jgi:hypothetical protein